MKRQSRNQQEKRLCRIFLGKAKELALDVVGEKETEGMCRDGQQKGRGQGKMA